MGSVGNSWWAALPRRGTFIRLRATVSTAEAGTCGGVEEETPEDLVTTTVAAVHADTAQEESHVGPQEALIRDEEAAGTLLQKRPKAWTQANIMQLLRSSSL